MSRLRAVATCALIGLNAYGLVAQSTASKCGVERWPVKIALDADVGRVNEVPLRATVSQLAELPRPTVSLPHDHRVGEFELRTFHVIAVVREVLNEDDSDLHVVIQDLEEPGRTIIAEIPDSLCALGSRYAGAFAEARRSLSRAPRYAIVVIDGIGFFDLLHGQRGVAPNGFELHPVLAIRVVGQYLAEPQNDSTNAATGLRAIQGAASATKVWVNSSSSVYHCPGSRWYGATKRGTFMSEPDALKAGAHAAYGRSCGPTRVVNPAR